MTSETITPTFVIFVDGVPVTYALPLETASAVFLETARKAFRANRNPDRTARQVVGLVSVRPVVIDDAQR